MKNPDWLFYLLLIFGVLAFAWPAIAAQTRHSIPVFLQIAEDVYRGGQPEEEGYEYLKSIGVKTIINFRHEDKWVAFGREMAEKYGMDFIHIPWKIYGEDEPEALAAFFEAMDYAENRPVFFHCRRGAERTSVMAGIYYMKYEGLSAEDAYDKATENIPIRWIWKNFVKNKFKYYSERVGSV